MTAVDPVRCAVDECTETPLSGQALCERHLVEEMEGWVWTDSIEPWLTPELVAERHRAWADRDTWRCPIHGEAVLRHERLSQFSGRSYLVCPKCDRVADWVRLGLSPSEERRREARFVSG